MTDASIIALYLKRSEQAIAESQNAYGRYCYRVAEGILNDASDSEESVNDTWLAAWDSIPPTLPQSLRAYLGTLTRCTEPSQVNGGAALCGRPFPLQCTIIHTVFCALFSR